MDKREIIWQETIRADIFAPDFCKQLRLEQAKLPPAEQPFYYNLDIQMPFAPLMQAKCIEEYLLRNSPKYCEGEDKFGFILSERAREIEDIFRALGYQLKDTCISGEPVDTSHEVILTLWKGNLKEYSAGGALKPVHRTTVIIPSRPDLLTLLQRTLAKQYAHMEEAVWDESGN